MKYYSNLLLAIRAINHPERKVILEYLKSTPKNVTEIQKHCAISKIFNEDRIYVVTHSQISQHLKILRESNLVNYKKIEKTHAYYRMEHNIALLEDLKKQYSTRSSK